MQDIEKLYKEYYPIIYKYLMCLTRNQEIAEELTQETFYKAIKKIHTYKGNAKISVWLCEIAKNLWYDKIRKKKYSVVSYEELENNISLNNTNSSDIENEYIIRESKNEVDSKIDKLDFLTKRVIYLRVNSELSFKEIGSILGKTETWARVTFYRGKQKIKEVNEDGKKSVKLYKIYYLHI